MRKNPAVLLNADSMKFPFEMDLTGRVCVVSASLEEVCS